jgi:prepilin-type N-terminal cleavage/methylation domain-containing protein
MKKSGFTLIELLMASVVLAVLAAIAIPNFTRSLLRAQESEVKSVAHSLQMAVEDYKATPGWEGLKPSTWGELTVVATCYLPVSVQTKRNPFNPTETYGIVGSGLQGHGPGNVDYCYSAQTSQYTILALGGDSTITILTLIEGQ